MLEMAPTPKGRPRFGGRNGPYTPYKTRSAEKKIGEYLREQILSRGYKTILGACRVSFTFAFQRPKSVTRKHHTVRPDGDNLQKLVQDAGNKILWHDDGLISEWSGKKIYSDLHPYIAIEVEELE